MDDIERNVEFGLDRFRRKRKIELPLRDVLYAYKAIGEFISFFHDPDHWKKLSDAQRFLGSRKKGGLHVLWEAYYGKLSKVWPPDVQKAFNDGLLDRQPVIGRLARLSQPQGAERRSRN